MPSSDFKDLIYDISPEISSRIAVFPGDTPFSRQILFSAEKGDSMELSSITTTVHLGAHTDAPIHYDPKGETMESRSLDYYLGPCQVISVDLKPHEVIEPFHIKNTPLNASRILFKTNSFNEPNQWNDGFNALSAELVNKLHEQKVITLGIDTPSIDPAKSKELPAHNAVAKNNMAIIEGIILKDVPDGHYELIALPLKLKSCDASPVRAILRKIQSSED